jgi:2-keto-4-pentenoate hydratase/2-oxohepta-3-ene-1,7-dioic acid hydratase in catechol pathway
MVFCRFQSGDIQGWGEVEQHEVWEVAPDIFFSPERTGRSFPMQDVRFLAPCKPSKIIAVGLNYKAHIEEFGRTQIPTEPVIFLKAPSAVIGLNEPIRLPKGITPVDYEAELAVVIGKRGRHIPEAQAMDYVLGCTCLNDVTARALQKQDGQWARAKSFDTFAPIGPWIVEGLPTNDLRVEAYVNNKTVQQGNTRNMIFPVPRLVSFISSVMTLEPGDVISTGTPMGVGPIKDGDVVEIFVEGVGRLRNPVKAEASL